LKIDEMIRLFFADAKGADFGSELDALENIVVRIAVIGRSGVGKSSLINALYGEKVAQTGSIETTEEPQEFNVRGLTLVDLPGCGTTRFPRDTYVEDLGLAHYDAFILVVAKRIYEDDLELMAAITGRLGKNVHVVRSMVDQDVANARRDGRTEEETLTLLRDDLAARFAAGTRLWLVASPNPRRFDFPALEASLSDDLTDRKRDKFVIAAQAYTEEQLSRKREVASRYVKAFAGLAAANGFNPIPGANILADVAIVLKMNDWILKCYKLDGDALARLGVVTTGDLSDKTALIAKKVLAYGTREFVKAALLRQAGRMTGKELAKWVPVVGQLAAAGLGFGLAHWMGRETIDGCEEALRELISHRLSTDDAIVQEA
jgi:uncharacterized protein (DUF697 family)